MKEKIAWASESWCRKCWAVLKAGLNQYPSHLRTWEGRKRWPSSLMGAVEGGVLGLGGRQ